MEESESASIKDSRKNLLRLIKSRLSTNLWIIQNLQAICKFMDYEGEGADIVGLGHGSKEWGRDG